MVAARRLPFAPPLRVQTDAYTEIGLHAELARHGEDLTKLRELLDDEDHPLAEALAAKRHAYEQRILVAVADDQAFRAAHHRQRREELGLAARLDAEVVRRPRVQNFFDDLAELI